MIANEWSRGASRKGSPDGCEWGGRNHGEDAAGLPTAGNFIVLLPDTCLVRLDLVLRNSVLGIGWQAGLGIGWQAGERDVESTGTPPWLL